MGETRITLFDEADDCHEIRIASDQATVRNYEPLVGVALHEKVDDMLGDTPIAIMQGWHAVVTDGDTGETYSGTITEISEYGFLFEVET